MAKYYGCKICTLFLVISFLFPSLGWAFNSSNYSQAFNTPEILHLGKPISIPKAIGAITQGRQGQGKTIICIQDLHCNYEVQKNIAGIIRHLAARHELKLVGEEGAAHTVKVDVLRDFPLPGIREQVSDYYVRLGKLTGAEHFAATAPDPIRLEGIEEPALYQSSYQTLRSFLNTESQGHLLDLREILDGLKRGIYPARLLQYDGRGQAYREGKLDALQYAALLRQQAQQVHLELEAFPRVRRFLEMQQAQTSGDVNPDELLQELEDLDAGIRARLYTAPEQRELDGWCRRLDILEKLLNVSATSGDLEWFRAQRREFTSQAFLAFIQKHPGKVENAPDLDMGMLDKQVSQAEAFYAMADERSVKFVENLIRRMDETKENLAVMITGGFHTEGIAAELQQRKLTYLSVQPRLSRQDVANPYFSLLQGKKLPLEKMLEHCRSIMAVPAWPQTPDFQRVIETLEKAAAEVRRPALRSSEQGALREFLAKYNIIDLKVLSALELSTLGIDKPAGCSIFGVKVKDSRATAYLLAGGDLGLAASGGQEIIGRDGAVVKLGGLDIVVLSHPGDLRQAAGKIRKRQARAGALATGWLGRFFGAGSHTASGRAEAFAIEKNDLLRHSLLVLATAGVAMAAGRLGPEYQQAVTAGAAMAGLWGLDLAAKAWALHTYGKTRLSREEELRSLNPFLRAHGWLHLLLAWPDRVLARFAFSPWRLGEREMLVHTLDVVLVPLAGLWIGLNLAGERIGHFYSRKTAGVDREIALPAAASVAAGAPRDFMRSEIRAKLREQMDLPYAQFLAVAEAYSRQAGSDAELLADILRLRDERVETELAAYRQVMRNPNGPLPYISEVDDKLRVAILLNNPGMRHRLTFNRFVRDYMLPRLDAARIGKQRTLSGFSGLAAGGKTTIAQWAKDAIQARFSVLGDRVRFTSFDDFLREKEDRVPQNTDEVYRKFNAPRYTQFLMDVAQNKKTAKPMYDQTNKGQLKFGLDEAGRPAIFNGAATVHISLNADQTFDFEETGSRPGLSQARGIREARPFRCGETTIALQRLPDGVLEIGIREQKYHLSREGDGYGLQTLGLEEKALLKPGRPNRIEALEVWEPVREGDHEHVIVEGILALEGAVKGQAPQNIQNGQAVNYFDVSADVVVEDMERHRRSLTRSEEMQQPISVIFKTMLNRILFLYGEDKAIHDLSDEAEKGYGASSQGGAAAHFQIDNHSVPEHLNRFLRDNIKPPALLLSALRDILPEITDVLEQARAKGRQALIDSLEEANRMALDGGEKTYWREPAPFPWETKLSTRELYERYWAPGSMVTLAAGFLLMKFYISKDGFTFMPLEWKRNMQAIIDRLGSLLVGAEFINLRGRLHGKIVFMPLLDPEGSREVKRVEPRELFLTDQLPYMEGIIGRLVEEYHEFEKAGELPAAQAKLQEAQGQIDAFFEVQTAMLQRGVVDRLPDMLRRYGQERRSGKPLIKAMAPNSLRIDDAARRNYIYVSDMWEHPERWPEYEKQNQPDRPPEWYFNPRALDIFKQYADQYPGAGELQGFQKNYLINIFSGEDMLQRLPDILRPYYIGKIKAQIPGTLEVFENMFARERSVFPATGVTSARMEDGRTRHLEEYIDRVYRQLMHDYFHSKFERMAAGARPQNPQLAWTVYYLEYLKARGIKDGLYQLVNSWTYMLARNPQLAESIKATGPPGSQTAADRLYEQIRKQLTLDFDGKPPLIRPWQERALKGFLRQLSLYSATWPAPGQWPATVGAQRPARVAGEQPLNALSGSALRIRQYLERWAQIREVQLRFGPLAWNTLAQTGLDGRQLVLSERWLTLSRTPWLGRMLEVLLPLVLARQEQYLEYPSGHKRPGRLRTLGAMLQAYRGAGRLAAGYEVLQQIRQQSRKAVSTANTLEGVAALLGIAETDDKLRHRQAFDALAQIGLAPESTLPAGRAQMIAGLAAGLKDASWHGSGSHRYAPLAVAVRNMLEGRDLFSPEAIFIANEANHSGIRRQLLAWLRPLAATSHSGRAGSLGLKVYLWLSGDPDIKYLLADFLFYANTFGVPSEYLPEFMPALKLPAPGGRAKSLRWLDIGVSPKSNGSAVNAASRMLTGVPGFPTEFLGTDILLPLYFYDPQSRRFSPSPFQDQRALSRQGVLHKGIKYFDAKSPAGDVTSEAFQLGKFDFISLVLTLSLLDENGAADYLLIGEKLGREPIRWIDEQHQPIQPLYYLTRKEQAFLEKVLGRLNPGGMLFLNLNESFLSDSGRENNRVADLHLLIRRESADTFRLYSRAVPFRPRGEPFRSAEYLMDGQPGGIFRNQGIRKLYPLQAESFYRQVENWLSAADLLVYRTQKLNASAWEGVRRAAEAVRYGDDLADIFRNYLRDVPPAQAGLKQAILEKAAALQGAAVKEMPGREMPDAGKNSGSGTSRFWFGVQQWVRAHIFGLSNAEYTWDVYGRESWWVETTYLWLLVSAALLAGAVLATGDLSFLAEAAKQAGGTALWNWGKSISLGTWLIFFVGPHFNKATPEKNLAAALEMFGWLAAFHLAPLWLVVPLSYGLHRIINRRGLRSQTPAASPAGSEQWLDSEKKRLRSDLQAKMPLPLDQFLRVVQAYLREMSLFPDVAAEILHLRDQRIENELAGYRQIMKGPNAPLQSISAVDDKLRVYLLSVGQHLQRRLTLDRFLRDHMLPRLEEVRARKSRTFSGFAGPAGSGKTTVAQWAQEAVQARFGILGDRVRYLTGDDFLLDKENRVPEDTNDAYKKFNITRFARFVMDVAGNKKAAKPIYDQTSKGQLKFGLDEAGRPALFNGANSVHISLNADRTFDFEAGGPQAELVRERGIREAGPFVCGETAVSLQRLDDGVLEVGLREQKYYITRSGNAYYLQTPGWHDRALLRTGKSNRLEALEVWEPVADGNHEHVIVAGVLALENAVKGRIPQNTEDGRPVNYFDITADVVVEDMERNRRSLTRSEEMQQPISAMFRSMVNRILFVYGEDKAAHDLSAEAENRYGESTQGGKAAHFQIDNHTLAEHLNCFLRNHAEFPALLLSALKDILPDITEVLGQARSQGREALINSLAEANQIAAAGGAEDYWKEPAPYPGESELSSEELYRRYWAPGKEVTLAVGFLLLKFYVSKGGFAYVHPAWKRNLQAAASRLGNLFVGAEFVDLQGRLGDIHYLQMLEPSAAAHGIWPRMARQVKPGEVFITDQLPFMQGILERLVQESREMAAARETDLAQARQREAEEKIDLFLQNQLTMMARGVVDLVPDMLLRYGEDRRSGKAEIKAMATTSLRIDAEAREQFGRIAEGWEQTGPKAAGANTAWPDESEAQVFSAAAAAIFGRYQEKYPELSQLRGYQKQFIVNLFNGDDQLRRMPEALRAYYIHKIKETIPGTQPAFEKVFGREPAEHPVMGVTSARIEDARTRHLEEYLDSVYRQLMHGFFRTKFETMEPDLRPANPQLAWTLYYLEYLRARGIEDSLYKLVRSWMYLLAKNPDLAESVKQKNQSRSEAGLHKLVESVMQQWSADFQGKPPALRSWQKRAFKGFLRQLCLYSTEWPGPKQWPEAISADPQIQEARAAGREGEAAPSAGRGPASLGYWILRAVQKQWAPALQDNHIRIVGAGWGLAEALGLAAAFFFIPFISMPSLLVGVWLGLWVLHLPAMVAAGLRGRELWETFAGQGIILLGYGALSVLGWQSWVLFLAGAHVFKDVSAIFKLPGTKGETMTLRDLLGTVGINEPAFRKNVIGEQVYRHRHTLFGPKFNLLDVRVRQGDKFAAGYEEAGKANILQPELQAGEAVFVITIPGLFAGVLQAEPPSGTVSRRLHAWESMLVGWLVNRTLSAYARETRKMRLPEDSETIPVADYFGDALQEVPGSRLAQFGGQGQAEAFYAVKGGRRIGITGTEMLGLVQACGQALGRPTRSFGQAVETTLAGLLKAGHTPGTATLVQALLFTKVETISDPALRSMLAGLQQSLRAAAQEAREMHRPERLQLEVNQAASLLVRSLVEQPGQAPALSRVFAPPAQAGLDQVHWLMDANTRASLRALVEQMLGAGRGAGGLEANLETLRDMLGSETLTEQQSAILQQMLQASMPPENRIAALAIGEDEGKYAGSAVNARSDVLHLKSGNLEVEAAEPVVMQVFAKTPESIAALSQGRPDQAVMTVLPYHGRLPQMLAPTGNLEKAVGEKIMAAEIFGDSLNPEQALAQAYYQWHANRSRLNNQRMARVVVRILKYALRQAEQDPGRLAALEQGLEAGNAFFANPKIFKKLEIGRWGHGEPVYAPAALSRGGRLGYIGVCGKHSQGFTLNDALELELRQQRLRNFRTNSAA